MRGRLLAASALVACAASVTGPAEGTPATAGEVAPSAAPTSPAAPASTGSPVSAGAPAPVTPTVVPIPPRTEVIDEDFEGYEHGTSSPASWGAQPGLTLTVDGSAAYAGVAGLRVAGDLRAASGVWFTRTFASPLPAGVYTFGAWVRLPKGQPPVLLNLSGTGGHRLRVTDAEWTRLYAYTQLPAGSTALSLHVTASSYCDGPLPEAFLLDDVTTTFAGQVTFTWYPTPVYTCPTPSPSVSAPSPVPSPSSTGSPVPLRPTLTRPTLPLPTPSTWTRPSTGGPLRTRPTVPPVVATR